MSTYHDNDCPALGGGRCRCHPVVLDYDPKIHRRMYPMFPPEVYALLNAPPNNAIQQTASPQKRLKKKVGTARRR